MPSWFAVSTTRLFPPIFLTAVTCIPFLRGFTNVKTASFASSLVLISPSFSSGRIMTTFLGGFTANCPIFTLVIQTFSAYVGCFGSVFAVFLTAVSSRLLTCSDLFTALRICVPLTEPVHCSLPGPVMEQEFLDESSHFLKVPHDGCGLFFIDLLAGDKAEG